MPGKPLNRPLMLAACVTLALAPAARADFRLERELAIAPGGTFVLETDSGAVEIRGSDRDTARILVTSPRDDVEERFSFSFEERGDDAVVRVEKRGGWTRGWFSDGNDRLRFEIQVPRGVDVDLKTAGGAIDAASIAGRVELHTSGGGVEIADVDGDVDAHTSGGAMSARDIRGDVELNTSGGAIRARSISGDLKAETSGGGIRVDGVGGDASLETSGGSIGAEEIGGRLAAHTSGGPVRASFAAGNGSGGTLSSSGGGITAVVDPAVALQIDAHSSGGRVSVDLPITVRGSMTRNSVRGELNGGGPLLKLRSSGGPVRLQGR